MRVILAVLLRSDGVGRGVRFEWRAGAWRGGGRGGRGAVNIDDRRCQLNVASCDVYNAGIGLVFTCPSAGACAVCTVMGSSGTCACLRRETRASGSAAVVTVQIAGISARDLQRHRLLGLVPSVTASRLPHATTLSSR